jgi:hypothetical protein
VNLMLIVNIFLVIEYEIMEIKQNYTHCMLRYKCGVT